MVRVAGCQGVPCIAAVLHKAGAYCVADAGQWTSVLQARDAEELPGSICVGEE